MAGGISSSVLLGWFQSFYGGKGTGTSSTLVTAASLASGNASGSGGAPTVLYAPTAPWNENTQPTQSQLVKQAMSGANLFNPSAAKLDLPGASADYKNLFALYSGLNTLYALATAASSKNASSLQISQYQTAFANGMAQLQKFLSQTSFAKLKLTAGTVQSSQTSSVATPSQPTTYITQPLNTSGNSSAVVPAFQGNVSFDINVQLGSAVTTVPINLANMGSTPRTMGNVVNYINTQLKAAGTYVTVSSDPIPAAPDTITVGNQTVTVSSGQESWALQINTNPAETVSLSAAQTGAEVYVGQIAGNQQSSVGPTGNLVAPDATSQLLTFNASGDGVLGPTTPAYAAPNQMSTTQLGSSVTSIQATAAAPDGSVYVLANVNQTTNGTTPAGGQDVALMKYDSAGNLVFSTDLGSAANASGLSLALSPNGSQVAIAGQVTGALTAGQTVNDPTGSNSFVAVYDSQGNKVWTAQDDGLTPNQANAVAFDSSGNVYVTGQSQASTTPQGAGGQSTSFLQVFNSSGVQVANTPIATSGSNTGDGVAVSGSDVYVAGVQNGAAVVNEYSISNPGAPTLVASRNLGSLGGGAVAGIQVQGGVVYVAGSARGGALSAGTVTSASTGTGLNAFAATLSTGLQPAPTDAVAYYGGSGDATVTGMSVANGQVYVTGSVTGSLPNEAAIGASDGYVAALNVGSGAVSYQQRFTGLDGQVAPTSIAVAPTGESVLNQLGLPQGVVNGPVSDLITSTTPVQAGDSFGISVNGAAPVTITVQATDTMASLASEISQATGYTVNASTSYGAGGSTTLEIQPADPGVTVTLKDGPSGSDALAGLGLKPGVVTDTATRKGVTVIQNSSVPIYGLGLPASLDFASSSDIRTAQVQLAGAVSVVEEAYQNLANAATPAAVLALQKAKSSGAVPTYLSDQIANYQSALTRLTAGQTSTTGVGVTSLFG